MAKIVLISCVSKKVDHPAPAKDLYTSTLFRFCYGYAQSLCPDKVFILSAKYGLVPTNKVIAPYNMTLNAMSLKEIQEWSRGVIREVTRRTDTQKDKFIFLAGEKYRKYLLSEIDNYEIPMQGLKIGEQLAWLKRKLKQ